MIYITYYLSPIGKLLLASDGIFLTGLWIEGQKYYLNVKTDKLIQNDELAIFKKTKVWLDCYFNGDKVSSTDILIKLNGTSFQKEVWEILQHIPYGTTTTYSAIPKEIAKRRGINQMSAQAVGGAVGWNPICIIVPCHRVIGTNGSLTGYGGGIKNKIELLKLEGVNTDKYSIPTKGTAL